MKTEYIEIVYKGERAITKRAGAGDNVWYTIYGHFPPIERCDSTVINSTMRNYYIYDNFKFKTVLI